jgi:clan AA aspartic protease (TIGR02281 family)
MRYLILLLLLSSLFLAGFVAGWWLRDTQPAVAGWGEARSQVNSTVPDLRAVAPFEVRGLGPLLPSAAALQVINRLAIEARGPAYLAYLEEFGDDYGVLRVLAALARDEGVCQLSISYLLRAALVVPAGVQQEGLEAELARVTDTCARSLVGLQRYADLDRIYESITLALPELSDYFMALGLLRIQAGNPEAALSALAQIQNHGRLGAQSRHLMAGIDANRVDEPAALEALPLIVSGGQLLVKAFLDNHEPVTLMIDTGAAMTILQPQLLDRLGYDLNGRQAYFSTANGVVQAPVVAINRLALGQIGIDQLSVGALSLQLAEGVDGLLGMNFLRRYQFRIDQDRGLLYLDHLR